MVTEETFLTVLYRVLVMYSEDCFRAGGSLAEAGTGLGLTGAYFKAGDWMGDRGLPLS